MELDELKRRMSKLDEVLSTKNSDIKIDVAASETAQAKLLGKFRKFSLSCLILAVVYSAMIAGGISPKRFSIGLNIGFVAYLLIGSIWYGFMYFKLKKIRIATLTPAKLFSKTANIRKLMISGELFFGIGILLLIFILYRYINPDVLWYMAVAFVIWLINSVRYWPKYIKLFRELTGVKSK